MGAAGQIPDVQRRVDGDVEKRIAGDVEAAAPHEVDASLSSATRRLPALEVEERGERELPAVIRRHAVEAARGCGDLGAVPAPPPVGQRPETEAALCAQQQALAVWMDHQRRAAQQVGRYIVEATGPQRGAVGGVPGDAVFAQQDEGGVGADGHAEDGRGQGDGVGVEVVGPADDLQRVVVLSDQELLPRIEVDPHDGPTWRGQGAQEGVGVPEADASAGLVDQQSAPIIEAELACGSAGGWRVVGVLRIERGIGPGSTARTSGRRGWGSSRQTDVWTTDRRVLDSRG